MNAEDIIRSIKTALDNDEMILPTLPEVALKVREAAEQPEVSVSSLAKAVENDVALTTRIIRVSNSPIYRGNKPAEELKQAINRLGIKLTANLITSLAMEQMFQATSDYVDEKLRAIWNKSTEVSGIAHVLCRHYTKLGPEQATLAGLTHEIGALPILTFTEDHPELLDNTALLEQIIQRTHTHLGGQILDLWGFAPELRSVPKNYLKMNRTHEGPADYTDIVSVANLQSIHDNPEHALAQQDWANVPAFHKLGLDTDVESSDFEDLSDEMDAAMALLR